MAFRLRPEPAGGIAHITSVEEEGKATVRVSLPGFSDSTADGKMLTLNIFVRGRPAEALIDCGSAINVLSSRQAEAAGVTVEDTPARRRAVMADGSTVDIKGVARNVQVRIGDVSQYVTFDVLDTTRDVILGMKWLKKVNPHIDWKLRTMQWVRRPMSPEPEEDTPEQVAEAPQASAATETITRADPVEVTLEPTVGMPTPLEEPTKPKVKIRAAPAKVVTAHRMAKMLLRGGAEVYHVYAQDPERRRPGVDLATVQVEADDTVTDPRLAALISSYADVFPDELPTKLVEHGIEHRVDTTEGIPPYYEKFRRIEYSLFEEMQTQLSDLLKQGRIRPSASPWGSPMVFVRKSDGTWRLCIDYRRLNAITARNGYSIPRMDELTDRLRGARVFTKIDLRQGYWQVRMAERDIPKTAFTTPVGQFEWLVMPMGLSGSGATFQRLMNTVFPYSEFPYVLVYLDDILVHSKDRDEHIRHVDAVLKRLRKAKLYAKLSKCVFAKDHVSYLGQTYGGDTVRADVTKTLAVSNWQPPQTITQLRSFIGVASQLRKHIRNYAFIAAPLTDQFRKAPKKQQGVHWGPEQHAAFGELKRRICQAPILQLYDPERETLVQTDASNKAIGAVLLQRSDAGDWLPVCYESRRLTDSESSFSVYELELLAVQHALTKWRQYLLGRSFTIQTDHRALERLPVQKVVGRRVARWVEYMQDFDFKIGYQQGKLNVIADALSRLWAREVLDLDRVEKTVEDAPSSSEVYHVTVTDTAQQSPQAESAQHAAEDEEVEINMLEQYPATLKYLESGMCMDEQGQERMVAAITSTAATLAPSTIKRIRDAYTRDKHFCTIHKALKATSDRDKLPKSCASYELVGELLYVNKGGYQRLCVAGQDEQTRVMMEYHDSRVGGHFGVNKTLTRMQRHVFWPHMARTVKQYIATCDTCQRTKPVRDKPQGLLQPIAVPTDRWQHISVDLAGPLPASNGYNAIAMVVDMFTKRVCLVPTRNDVTAEALSRLLFDNCFKCYGLPVTITSDRDTKFQSAFWQALFKRMGSTLHMTTSAHPEADGQSERMIGTMKQYLTTYANYAQSTWADDLPMAEWCMNSQQSATTGFSPFYVDTGREPRVPFNVALLGPQAEDRVETVEQRIATLLRIRDEVTITSQRAKAAHKKYADRKRRPADVYQPGEMVWLTSEAFRRDKGLVGEAAPLHKKWVGPYRVIAKDTDGNYQLDLEGRSAHDAFHPDKLNRFQPSPAIFEARHPAVPDPSVDSEGDEHWEVQEVLDRKQGRDKQWMYKVHWKGFPMERAQWVAEANLDNCRDLLADFNAKYVGPEELQRRRKRQSAEPHPDSGKRAKRERRAERWHLRELQAITTQTNRDKVVYMRACDAMPIPHQSSLAMTDFQVINASTPRVASRVMGCMNS